MQRFQRHVKKPHTKNNQHISQNSRPREIPSNTKSKIRLEIYNVIENGSRGIKRIFNELLLVRINSKFVSPAARDQKSP